MGWPVRLEIRGGHKREGECNRAVVSRRRRTLARLQGDYHVGAEAPRSFRGHSALAQRCRGRWFAVAAALVLAAAALALAALPSNPTTSPVAAETSSCVALDVEQDERGAGNPFELELNFPATGNSDCVTSVETIGVVTIQLPGEVGIAGFDKEGVIIHAGGAFQPRRVDVATGEHNTREIKIGACASWRDYSNAPPDCEVELSRIRITLRNLTLPVKPPTDDDYRISVRWSGARASPDALEVYPTLQIGDHDESARYGETVTFTGLGFDAGATVDVYAARSDSSGRDVACQIAVRNNWRKIAAARAGSDHRFTADVAVTEDRFPTAGRYLVCPRDGTGNRLDDPVAISVAGANVTVLSGNTGIVAGSTIDLLLTGNPGEVAEIRANGLLAPNQSRLGDVLTLTLPRGLSGPVTILILFEEGGSASVNVTVVEPTLRVAGVPGDGIALGGAALVSANKLSGKQVCRATLGGVRIALLDDRREFPEGGCVAIRPGGRFNATVLVADPGGALTAQVIGLVAALQPGDRLELEVTDDAGNKASALIPVASPEVTIDAPEGQVQRNQPIIIRGRNFPPNHSDHYQAPPVTVQVGDRLTRRFYPSGTGEWEFVYAYTSRHRAGENIDVAVFLGNLRPPLVIQRSIVRVTPFAIAAMPEHVRIGTPVVITITGLEPFTSGYGVRIRNGPLLTFDGSTTHLAADHHGNFTGTTRFPEYEPHSFDLDGDATIILEVVKNNSLLPGVHATLTQRRGHHPTPTLAVQLPTATPEPTPWLTATPAPTLPFTPTPVPTLAPVAAAPTIRAATPTPVPTDTPLPTSTIDRNSIAATAIASVAAPTNEPLRSGGSGGRNPDEGNPWIILSLLIGRGAVLVLVMALATIRMFASRWF